MATVDLDSLRAELEAASFQLFEDDASARSELCIPVATVLPIIARHLGHGKPAPLTEAGRLLPEGHVAIERGRWERVIGAMRAIEYDGLPSVDEAWNALQPGDLEPIP